MKISPSLKVYFLIIMIITGITTISIMSAVSFNYFLTGIDFSIRNAMRLQAYKVQVSDGKPIKIHDFIVASRWEDLPTQLKNKINEQDLVVDELLKSIDGNPLFGPPKAGYFAMKVILRHGEVRYVSSMFTSPREPRGKPPREPREKLAGEPKGKPAEGQPREPRGTPENRPFFKGDNIPPFYYLGLISLAVMALFALVTYFILRKVTTPVERLVIWTKQLNKKQLSQPIPDFDYSELNRLAGVVQSSLKSVQESLDREQQFLGYASHELRTPIAVTRTNTELLRKMISKNISKEKQLQVIDRLERASFNMTDLTETLLWLNRKPDKSIPLKTVSIGLLTQQLLEELTYLLNGKNVEVMIKTDQSTQQLPEALCRIVISNLIRNALQHTTEGKIVITQSLNKLFIDNQEFDHQEVEQNKINNELGFGLGLELTERLVKHYDWQYKNESTTNGHYVEIIF